MRLCLAPAFEKVSAGSPADQKQGRLGKNETPSPYGAGWWPLQKGSPHPGMGRAPQMADI